MPKLKLLLVLFFVWRIFLFLPLFVAHQYIQFNAQNKYVELWAYTRPYKPVDSFFLYPWANFDGVHYLTIAGLGYKLGAVGRFFPLYPLLIFEIAFFLHGTTIFGITQFFAAFLISNICFLASIIIFYKLLKLDYPDSIAMWSIMFLLLFPASFFYGAIYSESLFLLLTLLSFYFARKKQYLLAGVCGFLLTLTRVIGIFIVIALFFEFFHEKKWKFDKKSIEPMLVLFFIPIGLLSFMLFSYLRWHDALYFIHAQEAVTSGRSHLILFFPQTIFRYGKILLSLSPHQFEWWISLLEVTSFFVAGFLLYVGWRKKIRFSYLIFSFCCFLIPAVSGTFSGLPRYVSILFPIFIATALLKNKWVKIVICGICLIILFLLTMFFSRGYYIA